MHMLLRTQRYCSALADFASVAPSVFLRIQNGDRGLFVHSTGFWNEVGDWMCAVPWGARPDSLGRSPAASPRVTKSIRLHILHFSQKLLSHLKRAQQQELLQRISQRADSNPGAKLCLLARRSVAPGPPLHIALGWVGQPCNQAAISSLFCGDWFLAVHARNYFAKELLPLCAGDAAHDQVCLACWHKFRRRQREDEPHVLLACPAYSEARASFYSRLSESSRQAIGQSPNSFASLLAMFGSHSRSDWDALGELCGRIRQARRQNRSKFAAPAAAVRERGYCHRRAAWQALGRFVCTHGVLFLRAQGRSCPCMASDADNPARWRHARWMPDLDADSRVIIVRPFDPTARRRLGQIRGEMRRLG